MLKTTTLGFIVTALLLTTGQAMAAAHAASAADPAKAKAVDALIKEANVERKKAASVGGEWRDIGKMLKKAAAAKDKHDYATATKLATKAKRQGELGHGQAVSQSVFKTPSYLKY